MNNAAILQGINVLLAGLRLLRTLGVNYQQVIDAQERAEAEGRELSEEERQAFIDEAQDAIDDL